MVLWKCCTQYASKSGKTQQWPQPWKRSIFISIPKKGNAKECSNYCRIALISHANKVMLKIVQAGLQQLVKHEHPDVQAGFRKDRGTRDQIANMFDHWKIKRVPEKYLLLLYWIHHSFWLCGSQKTVENSSRGGTTRPPDLPPEKSVWGQEATVRTGHGTTDWFQIGKGVCQGCILSPCLFHLYAEYIMQNSRLDEAQAGIKIARKNVNNLRYADDTTLMAESEEEQKSLLMKVKEE